MTPSNNPDFTLIGTGEFSFAEGATTLTQAQTTGWRDFGNIKVFNLDPGGDKKEHMGSYRGITQRDRTRATGLKFQYKLTADEFSSLSLALMYMGTNGSALTAQAALAAVPGAAITFAAQAPSQTNRWYDVLSADGTHVFNLTGLTIATKVEGTDFEVDYKLGRIRFLVAQTAAVTPTLTAAAITAGGVGSFATINPLTQSTRTGLGRLHVFDDDQKNNIVWKHENFGCDLSLESGTDVKGDDWNDFSIMVAVNRPAGVVSHRNI